MLPASEQRRHNLRFSFVFIYPGQLNSKHCVTQLKLYTVDKMSSPIFCCLSDVRHWCHPTKSPLFPIYTGIQQGCISCLTCSYPELTEDHVLTSAYVKIFLKLNKMCKFFNSYEESLHLGVCKLAKYVRNCVVFWKNLHS